MVAKQQLEEVGFDVDLQVVDWATLGSRRNKPELWDVFSTGFVFTAGPAPTTSVPLQLVRAGGATRRRSGCSSSWRARAT